MLYSVILGNQQKVGNGWDVFKDEYGTPYIVNESIHQRIRLGKNVPKHLNVDYSCANVVAFRPENDIADEEYADAKAYKVAGKTFISNNNKNMNLALLNFYSKDADVMEAHVDDNIIYITLVSDNYQLIDYLMADDVQIIQTYRKKGLYQGCVISFKEIENLPEDGEVAYLYVKDLVKNRYIAIRISLHTTEDGKIRLVVNKEGINKKYLQTLIKIHKKLESQKRQLQFKISVPAGKFLTKLYITKISEVENLKKHLDENGVENYEIIEFADGESYESMCKVFDEHITKERIRAVTTYNIELPRNFCKDYNIMYLFAYDDKENIVKCLKSN